MLHPAIRNFSIGPPDFSYVGDGLVGPECVVTDPDGSIWTTDTRGGISHILPGGETMFVQTRVASDGNSFSRRFTPNGFCRTSDGRFLIADMTGNRVIEMDSVGKVWNVLSDRNGSSLGQINYVLEDRLGRTWIIVQSHAATPDDALNPTLADGQILLWHNDHVCIAASGLRHPNQLAVSDDGKTMYVPQTTARNIIRFDVDDNATLSKPTVVGPEDHKMFIDGIALDADGNIWGAHVGVDRIFVLSPDGSFRIIFEDEKSIEYGNALYQAFLRDQITSELLDGAGGVVAPMLTSIAFGGADLKTVYVGSLKGKTIACFRSPVPGQQPAHWNADTHEDSGQ